MGSVLKPLEKPFRTGASSAQRQAEEQARIQRQRMEEERKRFEQQQAEQAKRNEELKAQQEAARNQADLQAQLAQDMAAGSVDDTAEIQIGTDLTDGGTRKRKRKATGSSALGL